VAKMPVDSPEDTEQLLFTDFMLLKKNKTFFFLANIYQYFKF
jgi:hypothetical protein